MADKLFADVGRVITNAEFRERYIVGAGHELVNGNAARFNEMLAYDRKAYAARTRPLNLKAIE